MNRVQKLLRRVDLIQQDRPWLAFVLAAWKKFGDDQAGNLAALVAYYAFASIFPLLLVLYSVLGLVLSGDVSLQHKLESSALKQYPLIGAHYTPQSMTGAGVGLAVGLLLTLYGARGIANAIQNALNTVWAVPYTRRPGFPWSLLRTFGVILVVGPGMIITIFLAGLADGSGHLVPGAVAHVGAIIVSLILNVAVFWLAFRVGTAKEIATRDMRLGAIIAGVIWTILQSFGTYLISHEARTNSAYGTFGVVLGLLAWFYLQAQLTLYAVEFSVVRARGLWPRSLFPPPLTDADVRAYELYAAAQQRRPELAVELRRTDEPAAGTGRHRAEGSPAGAGDGPPAEPAVGSAAGTAAPRPDRPAELGARRRRVRPHGRARE
jgi:membrane protein